MGIAATVSIVATIVSLALLSMSMMRCAISLFWAARNRRRATRRQSLWLPRAAAARARTVVEHLDLRVVQLNALGHCRVALQALGRLDELLAHVHG